MKHALIIVVMLIVMVWPITVQAQSANCAYLDFGLGMHGFTIYYGVWDSGIGLRTVDVYSEFLHIQYDAIATIDTIDLVFDVTSWGGGSTVQYDRVTIDPGSAPSVDVVYEAASEGNHNYIWTDDPVSGQLIIEMYSSYLGGSGGIGHLRYMTICGSDLPSEWNPSGDYTYVDPWPTEEGWTRPTPTPWPTPEATLPFGVHEDDLDGLADTAINLYNFANQQGALDTLIWILMVLLILGLIFRFMKKAKAES